MLYEVITEILLRDADLHALEVLDERRRKVRLLDGGRGRVAGIMSTDDVHEQRRVGRITSYNVCYTKLLRTGVLITQNSIFANGSAVGDLGIDLDAATGTNNGDGVSANDNGDGDTGGNNRQNWPDLNWAVATGSNTVIRGQMRSTGSTTFTIEYFRNNFV